MKYFTLEECTYSETAIKKGISNKPSAIHKAHIVESIETLIDPLREAWETYCRQHNLGKVGIYISSGYRRPELNAAVGGSPTSAHCHGYAFDLMPTNKKMIEFKRFCRKFLTDKAFDQLISEGEDKSGTPSWIHVGYKNSNGDQRHKFLSMIDGEYYPMTE